METLGGKGKYSQAVLMRAFDSLLVLLTLLHRKMVLGGRKEEGYYNRRGIGTRDKSY